MDQNDTTAAAPSKRLVMVVDDNEINRGIVAISLSKAYDVIEAGNGLEALELLKANYNRLSLILLDLMMPVMDGKSFLAAVQQDPLLSSVPVIVVTSEVSRETEIECLEFGAADFLSKPFDAHIALNRMASLIRLRESDSRITAIERDSQTGLYNQSAFYLHSEAFMEEHKDEQLIAIVCEVKDYFFLNEVYDPKAIATTLQNIGAFLGGFEVDNVAGYLGSGTFAVLGIALENFDFTWLKEVSGSLIANGPAPDIKLKFGVCQEIDRTVDASTTFRAILSSVEQILDSYGTDIAVVDSTTAESRKRRRVLVNAMEKSLEDGDFYVVYQPKHFAATGELAGIETLVRWNHPELGFVSPGEFIPLFEENGFVSRLDEFVRITAYRDMKSWKEMGLDIVPVSANYSKIDLLGTDSYDENGNLRVPGDLPAELFHAEVTETMWTGNSDLITRRLEDFRKAGYKVDLDDFGTGFSSLSMLVDMPIDVIKLDMSFVRNLEKRAPIVKHSVKLAHELGLEVVAEGVEEEWQLNILRELGVDIVQGYYFSAGLKVDEFTEYLRKYSK